MVSAAKGWIAIRVKCEKGHVQDVALPYFWADATYVRECQTCGFKITEFSAGGILAKEESK